MAVFAYIRDWQSIKAGTAPNSITAQVPFDYFDTNDPVTHSLGVEVDIESGDNAQQAEVRIRDAVIAKALQDENVTLEVSNIFMHAIRRG